jgi:hypothetical protein
MMLAAVITPLVIPRQRLQIRNAAYTAGKKKNRNKGSENSIFGAADLESW